MNLRHTLAASALLCTLAVQAAGAVYSDPAAPLDDRVEDALRRMTLDEKIAIVHAQSKFSSPGVQRLGIPGLWCTDGPHGIRPEVLWDDWNQAGWTNDSCVAFPALTCLAATWDVDLASLYGRSLGEEALYRGKNVILGPGVNICRTPIGGRNFEYMGEDPYLAGAMAVPYIRACQDLGVAVCVKHFALNNHEYARNNTNVVVDERTLREIYLPAFRAAVCEGGAWSVMGSYNLYRGQHGCHNTYLLNDILKKEWGFDGAVVSDWGGTHDTRQAATNGLDLEMGTWTDGLADGASNAYESYFLARPYRELIARGELSADELDDKVRRVLRLIFRTSMKACRDFGSLCSDEHYAAARTIGAQGIVLLKNERSLLPISLDGGGRKPRILVVGENAVKMMTVGGGSSSLKAQREVSALDGIRHCCAGCADVAYARGYVGDVSGEYNGVTSGQDLSDSRSAQELTAEAVAMARRADYVIFVGGLNKSQGQDCEGVDRKDIALPYGQDELIAALAKANRHLVVVNVSGNPVGMPWLGSVDAVLQAWYLGSECGNALADVLFGKVNPSGKLPMTWPVRLDDSPAHSLGTYPGDFHEDTKIFDITYSEGIFVGYRWMERHRVKPLFAFGHGLSYTTFAYGKMTADTSSATDGGDTITFTVPVTNTGSVAGAEVVQLYIADNECRLERPEKELKGFAKVMLAPGETKTVTIAVPKESLAFYAPDRHAWELEPGDFTAYAASASDDVRSSCKFSVNQSL